MADTSISDVLIFSLALGPGKDASRMSSKFSGISGQELRLLFCMSAHAVLTFVVVFYNNVSCDLI